MREILMLNDKINISHSSYHKQMGASSVRHGRYTNANRKRYIGGKE